MYALKSANGAKGPRKNAALRGVGIVKGNPKLCFRCRKPIGKHDRWTKQTSPDGAYSIILHDRCSGKR